MTRIKPSLPADGLFLGRARVAGSSHPLVVTVRGGDIVDITSKDAPTVRDVCEMDDRGRLCQLRQGQVRRHARRDRHQQLRGRPRSVETLSGFPGRPAGRQGVRRHLRGQPAGARHRGAGARLGREGRRDPRRHRRADRARPLEAEARLRRGDGHQGQADRARRLVAISGGRHRARRGDLHQMPADGVGRLRRRCRAASGLDLEQSGAGDRRHRRRAAAGSSAPRSATTSICATSRVVRRCCSARPRTTTRRPRSGRSSGCSTRRSRSTT